LALGLLVLARAKGRQTSRGHLYIRPRGRIYNPLAGPALCPRHGTLRRRASRVGPLPRLLPRWQTPPPPRLIIVQSLASWGHKKPVLNGGHRKRRPIAPPRRPTLRPARHRWRRSRQTAPPPPTASHKPRGCPRGDYGGLPGRWPPTPPEGHHRKPRGHRRGAVHWSFYNAHIPPPPPIIRRRHPTTLAAAKGAHSGFASSGSFANGNSRGSYKSGYPNCFPTKRPRASHSSLAVFFPFPPKPTSTSSREPVRFALCRSLPTGFTFKNSKNVSIISCADDSHNYRGHVADGQQ
jgi:hypothetical protein